MGVELEPTEVERVDDLAPHVPRYAGGLYCVEQLRPCLELAARFELQIREVAEREPPQSFVIPRLRQHPFGPISRLRVVPSEKRDVAEGVQRANRTDPRVARLFGQSQRLVGVGFGGAGVTHATLVIGEVGEEHGAAPGGEVIVGQERLQAFPPLSHLAAHTPEVDEVIGGTGRIRGGSLLQTIERHAEVRLLVIKPSEEVGASSTQNMRATLLELIEEVRGMTIAQHLGVG